MTIDPSLEGSYVQVNFLKSLKHDLIHEGGYFDQGVNSVPGRSASWLQVLMGVPADDVAERNTYRPLGLISWR